MVVGAKSDSKARMSGNGCLGQQQGAIAGTDYLGMMEAGTDCQGSVIRDHCKDLFSGIGWVARSIYRKTAAGSNNLAG